MHSNNHNTQSNNRRRPRTMMKSTLLLATSACLLGTANAFAVLPRQTAFRPSLPKSSISTTSSTYLSFSMTPLEVLSDFCMTPVEEVLSDSSLIQAEFANGMTHALLDFGSLFGNAPYRLRMAAVVGRLFVIGQDVQHEVLPDEMAFQLGLLAIACNGLVNTLLPKWKAHFMTPTLLTSKDRQAFRSLFRPAGVSWGAFKELHSESMDWVSVEAGEVILKENDTEDAVYWLHQGDVQVWSQETLTHHISGRQQVAGLGLFGENRLAKLLDSRSEKKSTGIKAVAGENGATLLRMNTTKLEKLLKHDQELTNAIHRLAFMGMQDKLDALLASPEEINSLQPALAQNRSAF